MTKPEKVLIVAPFHPILKVKLEALGYQLTTFKSMSYEKILETIPGYTGLVLGSFPILDKAFFDKAKELKWVGRLGSGMENIDQVYATQKGITCLSSPLGNGNAVAEQALGTLLMLLQNVKKAGLEIQQQKWIRQQNRGYEIIDKRVGIIGLGTNGLLFADKLLALGAKVFAYDIRRNNYDHPHIKGYNRVEELYENVDVLSYHVPLDDSTRYYFTEEVIRKMKNPFWLLNLSRGPVVKQDAVFKGLKSGKILGAALDVWEEEPFWEGNRPEYTQQAEALMKLPNFIGTPHIGGYTFEAHYKMSNIIGEKVTQLITGK